MLGLIALAFISIFVVELPDKTFLATLVLATRYRPLYVWIGVGLAFAVQTVLAVAVGGVASLLPKDLIHTVAGLIFLAGAVILLREGRSHQNAEEDEEEYAEKARPARGARQVLAAFMVLFAAEWGDLSQLLTISLVAKYKEPIAIFVGALAALLVVSGLAVIVGKQLLRFVKLHVLHFAGSAICLVLGVYTLVGVATS
ncbi:TMEM165/GDT1 family protein [Nocardioides sp.]|jgi:putative Ca2+/H+ antiporter (TMEM165/GDT1 family)|uniref:TMEM165/GDT1 family protein n=1 Tax=Nocardioides sp. TaxID=35761 RepID=UPI002CB55AE7|nr:TMEM165/GDT1 family protein [Nocardioides sp.]HVX55673.1 TMEM165/GDT1 family protein [Nocardioides sp.]